MSLSPFTEVGREVNQLQSDLRRLEATLCHRVEDYKFNELKSRVLMVEDMCLRLSERMSQIEVKIETLANLVNNET